MRGPTAHRSNAADRENTRMCYSQKGVQRLPRRWDRGRGSVPVHVRTSSLLRSSEFSCKHLPCPRKMAFDCARWEVEHKRDVFDRSFLVVIQHNHVSQLSRQLLHTALEIVVPISRQRSSSWRGDLMQCQSVAVGLTTQVRQSRVPSDGVTPSTNRRPCLIEPFQTLPHLQECILCNFLGSSRIAHHREHKPEDLCL